MRRLNCQTFSDVSAKGRFCERKMNSNQTNTYTSRANRADVLTSLRGGTCVSGSVWVEMPQKDFIAHEPGGSSR